ncbi:MAG: hypothetical protein ACI9P8_001600 [Bacteroidia bacterium]|jgi:uncharacterized protein YjeT (DUF2065 family)
MPDKQSLKGKKKRQAPNAILRYSGMAAQMAAIIMLFVFAGMWLDGHFEMEKPLYTAGLTVLGVVLSVYYMIKDLMK